MAASGRTAHEDTSEPGRAGLGTGQGAQEAETWLSTQEEPCQMELFKSEKYRWSLISQDDIALVHCPLRQVKLPGNSFLLIYFQ